MNPKQEFEVIKQKIIPVLQSYKITKASIFGSYARQEQTEKSDVDILVKLGDDVGLIQFSRIKLMLEKAIGKKVDLVEYETIRKELRENILRDEIPILA